jgi:hypothetical protein
LRAFWGIGAGRGRPRHAAIAVAGYCHRIAFRMEQDAVDGCGADVADVAYGKNPSGSMPEERIYDPMLQLLDHG